MSDKLQGLHPSLISKLNQVIAAMKALGFDLVVVQGLRTTEQQQALYAQGRTAPGKIVTNADGVKNKSNHQAHLDGYGHAADCAFKVKGTISWDDHLPWRAYGECAKAVGLVWGGDWHSIIDRPHVELP
jgi:peptidoglycan L-alanyl-D-glutamate endopeptidase CwlK